MLSWSESPLLPHPDLTRLGQEMDLRQMTPSLPTPTPSSQIAQMRKPRPAEERRLAEIPGRARIGPKKSPELCKLFYRISLPWEPECSYSDMKDNIRNAETKSQGNGAWCLQ